MTNPYGATYSKFLYGDELYGEPSTIILSGTYNWAILVDWNGDGLFEGTNEADRLIDVQCSRGRKNFLQPNGQGFYPISVGSLRITLSNHDGKYDAWNTNSPLYPNVTYGRDIKITVTDIQSTVVYPFFYGIITDIVPSGYGADAIVTLVANDGLRFLRDNYATVALQSGITPGDAIGLTLDSISWPARWGRSISTSTDNIPNFALSGSNNSADDINSIADTFFGVFFIGADGVARYRDKSSTNTITDYNQNIILKDIGNPQPWIYSRNITKIITSTYLSTSSSTATYYGTGYTSQPRTFKLFATWLQSTSIADTNANTLGAFLVALHPTPIIQIVNRPAYQLAPELFDRITATITTLGIDTVNLRIGGIEHIGKPQELRTTFYLEPYI